MRYAQTLRHAALALAISALVPWPLMDASDAARDFTRCLHFCGDLYAQCQNGCESTCTLSLNDETEAQSADCRWMCHQACNDSVKSCKVTCKEIRDPQPPGARTVKPS